MGKVKGRQGAVEGKRLFASEKRRSRRNAQKKSLLKRQMLTTNDSTNSEESISNFPTTSGQVFESDVCSMSTFASSVKNPEPIDGFSQSDSHRGISLEGRRLADIGYLFKQIAEMSKHAPFDCTFSDMYPVHEYRMGLKTKIRFVCKMCNIEKNISLIEDGEMDINSVLALATVSTGSGYSAMNELLSVLNVPFMSSCTYQQHHENIADIIEETAWKSMEEAGQEEARIARELGEVDESGIPLISVIADGAWSKRSYSVNYNASSGVACIIGARTRKILFLGVRNKYCSVCSRSAVSEDVPLPKHNCYKNWNDSSTSMESDIIVEGFKRSIEMHGLKFHKLIGDGDSSVYQKLLEARPYGTLLIQKIECRNHLMRNFSKKIRDICDRKRSNSKNLPVPPGLRKLVEANARRLRTSIKSATIFRIREETSFVKKVENLCQDLRNVPSHVFGQHEKCQAIAYFKCSPKANEVDHIPSMRACGLLDDIEVCINRLVFNASSLIADMDTNIAEQYNSIICKFVGGKRINFSLKRSYATRCKAAAISFNSAGSYYDVVKKRRVPFYTKKFVERMKRRRELQKIIRRNNKNIPSKSMRKHALPDKDYGPDAVPDPDLPADQFERKKQDFLNSLKKTPEEIQIIERNTRGQSGNPLWQQERSVRLTASNFGDICKMRKKTSCVNKVKNLLYSTFGGNASTKYGTEHEPFAIRQLENDINVKVEPCGMFIDEHDFIFGASPDGLVGDEAIVEVKCPKTASKMHPMEAIDQKIINFCTIDENRHMQLKRNHNYYYQIQGQLHITQRSLCYFVVWTPLGMLVEKINRDDSFWANEMKPKLEQFYNSCLLPELIDPRYPRKLEIRNPPWQ